MPLLPTIRQRVTNALRLPSRLYRNHSQKPEWRFLSNVAGVIHVGASVGQERALYNDFGLRVLWIEPIPTVFSELVKNIAPFPAQRGLNNLITADDGKEYELFISNNAGESSSLLQLSRHKDMWPEVAYTESINLRGLTLTTALKEAQISPDAYDALVLDTQGTELRILHGAQDLLPMFRYIKVEVPDFESYAGCCRIEHLSEFMLANGFHEVVRDAFSQKDGVGTYYDIVYQRS